MCGCSGGACMVDIGGGHVWLIQGGAWLPLGGHVWLLRGEGMCGCLGVCVVAPGGACMGYDEIRRYGQ